jgi:dTDP-4-dehydrorhamnose reductase
LRCLIIGADGTFGATLAGSLRRAGHQVLATTRRPDSAMGAFRLDLAAKLPLMPEADVAVICAAMARFEDCRRYPDLAHRVNVAAPLELGRSLTRAGARVIFLSSSVVFDCRKPHMSENEQPMPASTYGRLKAEAEAGLLDLGSLVSVLRLTKVVRPDVGILSEWIGCLGTGETVRAFEDHRFCPLTVAQVVDAIVALAENGEGGIYHVSGAADVSYADSARFLAQRIGALNDLVEAVRGIENGLAEGDLTPFTSLATGRLSRLTGFVPPEPFDVLQAVYGRKIDEAREMLAARAG